MESLNKRAGCSGGDVVVQFFVEGRVLVVQIFVDNDSSYLQWVTANLGGFVVNCDREPRPRYLRVHRATCRTVTGTPPNGRRWTTLYAKVCSPTIEELQRWASQQVGGQLTKCGTCKP
jgi:hypothetical protein